MKFREYFILGEAIRIRDVKKKKLFRKYGGAYRIESMKRVFGDKDRLVYDIELGSREIGKDNPLIERINKFLMNNFDKFRIRNVGEYRSGVIYGEGDIGKKQPRKIGRLLGSIGGEEANDLLEAFKKDPFRLAKRNEYKVVISRHPYDIAGMSTDRNWRSCMTLGFPNVVYKDKGNDEEGINNHYVMRDVLEGSIIAYLISGEEEMGNGKVNIRRPLSRILMKPYINRKDSKDIVYSLGRMYGASIKEFSDFVENWLRNNINTNTEGKKYYLKPNLYPDGDKDVNFKSIKFGDDMGSRIFFEELSYKNESNRKYEDFFEFLSTDASSTESEIKITFDIPEGIELNSFYYSRRNSKFPKYIREILEGKDLPDIGMIQSVQSFVEDRTIVIEYRDRGYRTVYEDDKGNDIPLDEYELEEIWIQSLSSYKLRRVNYEEARKRIIGILEKFDFVGEKELEVEKLKKYFEERFDLNSDSVSFTIKDFTRKLDNGFEKYMKCKKYFESLENIDLEELVNISKTEDYRNNLKYVHEYMGLRTRFKSHIYPLRYMFEDLFPLLGQEAFDIWDKLIEERFPVNKNLITKRLGKNIVVLLKQLKEFYDTHTKEENDYIQNVIEDMDTAFEGKPYNLEAV